jgi:hypothetical protein
MTTLTDRYEAVHTTILAGPNRELQEWIDSGTAWQLEGHVGRTAMDALRNGHAVLPAERNRDYYGSTVPSYLDVRDEVDSPGSVANAEAAQDNDDDAMFVDYHDNE